MITISAFCRTPSFHCHDGLVLLQIVDSTEALQIWGGKYVNLRLGLNKYYTIKNYVGVQLPKQEKYEIIVKN
jgi:hypothetical protein